MKHTKVSLLKKFFASLPLCSLVPNSCQMEGKEKKIKKNKVLPSQDEEVSDEVLEEIEAQIEVDEDWEDEEAAPVTAIPSKIIVVEESEIVLSDEPKKRELKAEDVAVDIDENSNDNKKNATMWGNS